MTIRLLPGHGVELPWVDQPLRFGMTLDEVRTIVKPHADLHDTFVCNSAWAKRFTCDGLELVVFAGEVDALLGVSASRTPDQESAPVGLDDIDLFGWPLDEVVDALREVGRDVRVGKHDARVDHDLHLMWVTPPPAPVAGKQWVPPPPAPFLTSVCLYASRER